MYLKKSDLKRTNTLKKGYRKLARTYHLKNEVLWLKKTIVGRKRNKSILILTINSINTNCIDAVIKEETIKKFVNTTSTPINFTFKELKVLVF